MMVKLGVWDFGVDDEHAILNIICKVPNLAPKAPSGKKVLVLIKRG